MVHKPGRSHNEPSNFRPICLMSQVYKILMSIVHTRTMGTIEQYIRDSQYGSRPGRRCAGPLSIISTVAREIMSEKGLPSQMTAQGTAATPLSQIDEYRNRARKFMITVDFKGAFDSVSQKRLIQSLYEAGWTTKWCLYGGSAPICKHFFCRTDVEEERGCKMRWEAWGVFN